MSLTSIMNKKLTCYNNPEIYLDGTNLVDKSYNEFLINNSGVTVSNNYLNFNGSSYLTIADYTTQLDSDFTLEFVVNLTLTNVKQSIVGRWKYNPTSGTSNECSWLVATNDQGKLYFTYKYTTSYADYSVITTNTVLATNTDYRISITRSANTLTIFVNGIQVLTTTITNNILITSYGIVLGYVPSSPAAYLTGKIKYLVLYNHTFKENCFVNTMKVSNSNTLISATISGPASWGGAGIEDPVRAIDKNQDSIYNPRGTNDVRVVYYCNGLSVIATRMKFIQYGKYPNNYSPYIFLVQASQDGTNWTNLTFATTKNCSVINAYTLQANSVSPKAIDLYLNNSVAYKYYALYEKNIYTIGGWTTSPIVELGFYK